MPLTMKIWGNRRTGYKLGGTIADINAMSYDFGWSGSAEAKTARYLDMVVLQTSLSRAVKKEQAS